MNYMLLGLINTHVSFGALDFQGNFGGQFTPPCSGLKKHRGVHLASLGFSAFFTFIWLT